MNAQHLIAAGIHPTQARAFAMPMLYAGRRFDITTPERKAAFVAQCAHESAMFTRLEESLWYRSADRISKVFGARAGPSVVQLVGNPKALANRVYANRNGNRSEASGDGWRFRGRGLIQLTGRSNYYSASTALQRPYIERPDLLLQPGDAALTAAWFWKAHGCNELADAGDIDGITRKINGAAMAGAADRRVLYADALEAFSDGFEEDRPAAA